MASDDVLLARAQAGDRPAFAEVASATKPSLLRLLHALGLDDAAAEDALSETWVRALGALSTFDAQRGSARAWLLTIARHVAYNSYRDRREVAVAPTDDDNAGATLFDLAVAGGWGMDPHAATEHKQSTEQLARALAELPELDRTILLLRDVEGLSGEETATVAGVSLAAQKSRLHRARLRAMALVRAHTTHASVADQERTVAGLACRDVLDRLPDYAAGELTETHKAQVDAHLRGCAVCERFGGRYVDTIARLRQQLGAAPAFDPQLVERIRAQLT